MSRMKRLPALLFQLGLLGGLAGTGRAAGRDKGLDILISADAIPSPEGFRPKPGQPIHYLYFQTKETLGDAIAGVKLPEPGLFERAVTAELAKQGFVRAREGGPLPEIGIIAVVGDSNMKEPVPSRAVNPFEDGDLAPYFHQVNLRQLLQPTPLWTKVPHTVEELFNPLNPYPPSNPDVSEAQDLVYAEVLRLRRRGSQQEKDRQKLKALVGADKVERAVANRTLGGLEAERIATTVWENQYYITLTAFDARRQEKGGRVMLWRTTMLVDWRVDLAKALPDMLAQAGPLFGTDAAVPGYVNTARPREGRVEIGEAKVISDQNAAKGPGGK
jgi:hypothetical protein